MCKRRQARTVADTTPAQHFPGERSRPRHWSNDEHELGAGGEQAGPLGPPRLKVDQLQIEAYVSLFGSIRCCQVKIARFLPRFQQAYRALDTLAMREAWSRQEIESFQLDRLNTVWQHAIAHVPHYRQLAAQSGLPPRFSSLPEFRATVPILSKTDVRDQPRAFLSNQAKRGHWHCTSGSTGRPMSCYWAKDAYLEMHRSKYRFLAMWGLDVFDRTVYLWGHSASFSTGLSGQITRFWQLLEDRLRNRLRLSAYRLGHDDLRDHLQRIGAFEPAAIYGYSRALYLLALEAQATDFRCDSLRLFTLTSEPASFHIIDAIEKVFGVPAVLEYGSVECGLMAAEWPDRTLRVREDVTLLETLPRQDGRYDIIVTVLNNPSFPLIRYTIGDLTDTPLELPTHGFAILGNVAGRKDDFVLSGSGRYLDSTLFYGFFEHHKAIRGFRVHQHAGGAITAAIEIDGPATALDIAALERHLEELVEGYPVKLEVVNAIPLTAAGKNRAVMSDLDLVHRSMPHGELRS
jgi:phenylacetate-coenzyme A ligase PaaK-like adenylate-forming protein